MTRFSHNDSPVLVLPPRRYLEQRAVEEFWRKLSWPVVRLAKPDDPGPLPLSRVRLYGDYGFCVTAARALHLELVSPADDFLMHVPPSLLLRSVELITLGELFGHKFPLFLKPVPPKLFPARVYSSLADLARTTEGLLPETQLLVEEPIAFSCEARCLVLDKTILSASVYEGKGDADEAATFALECVTEIAELDQTLIPSTLVLDVGIIKGKGWAIIEPNAIWAAGLNGCDPAAMAECVLAATQLTPGATSNVDFGALVRFATMRTRRCKP